MLLVGATLATTVVAQTAAAIDPYTRGEKAAIAAAGYEAIGEFAFANGTTRDVVALLGDEKLCWIETPHFRIGCAASSGGRGGPKGLRIRSRSWPEASSRP